MGRSLCVVGSAILPVHVGLKRAPIAPSHHDCLLVALLVLDLANHHALGYRLENRLSANARDINVHEANVLNTASKVGRDLSRFRTVLVSYGSTGGSPTTGQKLLARVRDAISNG